jgi:hypothetical protein
MARDSEGGLVSIAYLSAGLALSPIETNSLSELSSFKPSFIRTLTSTSTPPPPFSNATPEGTHLFCIERREHHLSDQPPPRETRNHG